VQEATDALADVFVGVVEGFERPPRLEPALECKFGIELRLFDFLQSAIGVVNEDDFFRVQQSLGKDE